MKFMLFLTLTLAMSTLSQADCTNAYIKSIQTNTAIIKGLNKEIANTKPNTGDLAEALVDGISGSLTEAEIRAFNLLNREQESVLNTLQEIPNGSGENLVLLQTYVNTNSVSLQNQKANPMTMDELINRLSVANTQNDLCANNTVILFNDLEDLLAKRALPSQR